MDSINTKNCYLCGKDVAVIGYWNHVPICYREFCITKLSVVPYCTCNTCCGTKTHDGDYIEDGKPGRREKRKMEARMEDVDSNSEALSRQQVMGKHCIECRKGKPPSHLFVSFMHHIFLEFYLLKFLKS